MNWHLLILVLLVASVFLTVFAYGLGTTSGDLLYLFRRPSLLWRSLLSLYVILPLFAVVVVGIFRLTPAVEIALVALALSPNPPLLPQRALKGGSKAYTFGLLFTVAMLAIVLVPLGLAIVARLFDFDFELRLGRIIATLLLTVLLPLTAGAAVLRLAPTFAERARGGLSLVALVALVAGVIPVIFVLMPQVLSIIGNGTILVLVAFVVVGLVVGHLLGGPKEEERTVLSLATAVRHPGIALAIAAMTFPEEKHVTAAVLLYLLVNFVVSLPYLRWRQHSAAPAAPLEKKPA